MRQSRKEEIKEAICLVVVILALSAIIYYASYTSTRRAVLEWLNTPIDTVETTTQTI